MKRRIVGISALVFAAMTVVGGVSYQIAKSNTPTVPTAPIDSAYATVPLRRQVLSDVVTIRGTAEYSRSLTVRAPVPSPLDPGSSPVVTRPLRSSVFRSQGSVAYEVSGRPIFIVRGDVPMYRDLREGIRGSDVLQLQGALVEMGFHDVSLSGVFDEETSIGVVSFYVSEGFRPRTVKEGSESTRRSIDELWAVLGSDSDEQTKDSAERKLIEAYTPLDPFVAADEILVVPFLPISISGPTISWGATVERADLTIRSTTIRFEGDVPAEVAMGLRQGMSAELRLPTGLDRWTGEVESVERKSAAEHHVVLTISNPQEISGGDLLIASVVLETSSEEVFAVPLAALHISSDSTGSVQVLEESGVRTIPVEIGLFAEGLVEIAGIDEDLVSEMQILIPDAVGQ